MVMWLYTLQPQKGTSFCVDSHQYFESFIILCHATDTHTGHPSTGVRGLKIHIDYFTSLMVSWRSYILKRYHSHARWRDFAVFSQWLIHEQIQGPTFLLHAESGGPYEVALWDRYVSFHFWICMTALCVFWVLQKGKKQLLSEVGFCNSRKSRRPLLSF